MSKTRYINTAMWADPWFVDELNPLDRYLFIYLISNGHTTIAGVYEISLRTISFETGLEKDEVTRMLGRLAPKVQYIDGWIVMANGIKNQNYNSPKIKTGIELVLQHVPNQLLVHINWPHDYKPKITEVEQQKLIPYTDGMDTLSHSNTNSNTKSKPNSKAPAKATAARKRAGPNKLGGEHKRQYARAVAADKLQAERVSNLSRENSPGYHKAVSIAEELKQRKGSK